MAGEDNNNESERPTALIHRDALLGLIDQSAEHAPSRPHTVPRDQLKSRGSNPQIVDVAPLQATPPSATDGELDQELSPPLSPLVVLAVIAVLVVTFIAATQLR